METETIQPEWIIKWLPPLLVIHGELYTLGSESQNAWATALPNGNLITIPEAGKATLTDQPEHVVLVIRDFLKGESL